jgi:hypothetical protein
MISDARKEKTSVLKLFIQFAPYSFHKKKRNPKGTMRPETRGGM